MNKVLLVLILIDSWTYSEIFYDCYLFIEAAMHNHTMKIIHGEC